jgi:parallel beta-helix repeat protein
MYRFKICILVFLITIILCSCGRSETERLVSKDDDLQPVTTTSPFGESKPDENIPISTTITTSGSVEQDEIWQGDILITGDILIPPGITVTVEPGTTIRFTAQKDDQHSPDEYDAEVEQTWHTRLISIFVAGSLEARGTDDQPIVFTSDRQVIQEMDWESIMIEGDGAVYLDYVTIEHCHFGIQLNSPTLKLTISNSTFKDIYTCAVCGHGARPNLAGPVQITYSSFIQCGRECVDTYSDQNIIIRGNIFSENHVGIMSVGSAVIIEGNLFINNGRGIGVIENGTPSITGNAFTQTQGPGIFVTDASPLISNNNFFENIFNLQMEGGTQNLAAENNWWGTADSQVIAELIFDGLDDPGLGVVDFEPYAFEAFDLDIPDY